MPIGSKLVILLCLFLTLHYPAAESNPAENRVVRSDIDFYDWLTSLFDYDESEEVLLCRNCTVVVNQDNKNGTDTTAAPVAPTAAPTVAPTAATAAPTPPAAPPAAPPAGPPAQPPAGPPVQPPAEPPAQG